MWEWTIDNPGWTSIIVIWLFLCLVYAPALLIAVIPQRRSVMAKEKKNTKTTERKIAILESTDGKFTASMSNQMDGVHCNCLMVGADKEGDPLEVSCCHPDVVAAAKKRGAQIDVPVLVKGKR
jgi:hypothetical protein